MTSNPIRTRQGSRAGASEYLVPGCLRHSACRSLTESLLMQLLLFVGFLGVIAHSVSTQEDISRRVEVSRSFFAVK